MPDHPSSSLFLKYLISNTITLFQSIQVAKSIKVVYSYTLAAVFISLDMGIIEKAGLNIDANIVKESILQTGKLKLKPEVKSTSCNYEFLFYSIYAANIESFFYFCRMLRFWILKSFKWNPKGVAEVKSFFNLIISKICFHQ